MAVEGAYLCENCAREIEGGDQTFVWHNHVVCHACYQALHVSGGKLLSQQMGLRKCRYLVMGVAVGLICLFGGGILGWYLHAARGSGVVQHSSPSGADAVAQPVDPR